MTATDADAAADLESVPRDRPILLFDGVCNLCNGSIQFVIEHDDERRFRFAPLQSEVAERLLEDVGYEDYDFDSFVLVDGEDYYTKSTAALRVASELGGYWSLLGGFRVVPRPLRDAVYDLVATYRYLVFGKRESCMIPTPDVRERFLDESQLRGGGE
jgi:predicted DCC family thiol-disulfide oxidoreductase YuxK